MKTSEKDGGPAFPFDVQIDAEGGRATTFGMSLRDYFAAAALQGILAANHTHFDVSEHAYKIADAMLAARDAARSEDK